ncbi:MAG: hypothetical protein U1A78_03640 [Polyangia bacterium]
MSQATSCQQNQILSPRLGALVALRYEGYPYRLAARLGISPRTLAYGMQQGRVSARVADQLERELGTAAWRFVTGQTDTLTVEGGARG